MNDDDAFPTFNGNQLHQAPSGVLTNGQYLIFMRSAAMSHGDVINPSMDDVILAYPMLVRMLVNLNIEHSGIYSV